MTVIEPSRWQFGITTVDQSWVHRVFRKRLTGALVLPEQASPPVAGPQSAESFGGRP